VALTDSFSGREIRLEEPLGAALNEDGSLTVQIQGELIEYGLAKGWNLITKQSVSKQQAILRHENPLLGEFRKSFLVYG